MAVVGDVDETGLAKIPFASQNAIAAAEVEGLVTVSFKVGEAVETGQYDVTLKGTMFEYNATDKDYAEDVTFKVNVVKAHTVVLSEDANRISICIDDQIVTGISSISVSRAANDVYTLAGQKVETMKKGLYIANGKKLLVK